MGNVTRYVQRVKAPQGVHPADPRLSQPSSPQPTYHNQVVLHIAANQPADSAVQLFSNQDATNQNSVNRNQFPANQNIAIQNAVNQNSLSRNQPPPAVPAQAQGNQNQDPPQLMEKPRQEQVDWSSRIAEVIQSQFGLKPKVQNVMYRTPYLAGYDLIPYPHRYKVPEFTKYSGQEDVSTMEHVSRFLMQRGEAAAIDPLKVRLFSC